MTTEKDIVLIHYEDKPLVFARVEDIQPDAKKDWYHIRLMMLQLPVQMVTWILKDEYINGAEFTMGGRRMRLEKIEPPETDPDDAARDDSGDDPKPPGGEGGTVISFKDRKPK